jgi:hypothetical protein
MEKTRRRTERGFTAMSAISTWGLRFFCHAGLYSVDALIGGYRFHSDAISAANMERYTKGATKLSRASYTPSRGLVRSKYLRRVSSAIKNIPKAREFGSAWS